MNALCSRDFHSQWPSVALRTSSVLNPCGVIPDAQWLDSPTMRTVPTVMAGLVPAIHVFPVGDSKVVDGRAKPGHDGWCNRRTEYVKISGSRY